MHRAIKFNQEPWLYLYIDVGTEIKKSARNDSKKMINNAVFGKTTGIFSVN